MHRSYNIRDDGLVHLLFAMFRDDFVHQLRPKDVSDFDALPGKLHDDEPERVCDVMRKREYEVCDFFRV